MKRYLVPAIAIILLSSCISPTAIPTIGPAPSVQPTPQSTPTRGGTELPAPGEIALSHVNSISNEIGPRPTGTENESKTAEYIATTLKDLGYTVENQPFDVLANGRAIRSTNVIAVKKGLSPQELIVGAHYDSVRVDRGADDNASGVGVLLEVAERLRNVPTPYTIRFILFGAEEVSLEGSKSYASQMTEEEIQNTVAMINLDSLIAGDIAYVYGDPGQQGSIRDWALKYAESQDLNLQTQPGTKPEYPPGTTGDWSDHAPFKSLGIQYVYFESTNWMLGDQDGYTQVSPEYGKNGRIWHTRYDTLSYIDTTFPGRVQERLNLFVIILEAILTDYQSP